MQPRGRVGRQLFAVWRDAGVGRVSFGVQSMVPHVLAGLGRRHDPGRRSARAVALAAEAGFASVNVDLIFGGAGETDDDFRHSLEAVLALEPPPGHVSAYALTVEPGHPSGRATPSRHPDDDVQARRYAVADDVLAAAGYDWYEVSNWARPGHRCRHNRLYWAQGDYRGIGAAAHSHRDADGGGGTSGHPSATSRPSRRAPGDGGGGGPVRDRAPLRGPGPGAADVGRGARVGGARRPRPRRPGRAARRPGRAHGARAGCSPTR